jgi:dTDP-4-amino-4,6-dideoxygalactose transaminase
MEFEKFAIGFDHRDRERLHTLWESILDTNQWSDGPLVKAFEETWTAWNGLPSVATSAWTGSALAALEFFELRGKTVLCPSNTFMATPLACVEVGAKVEFVDCNRDDLCMSFDDLERKVQVHKPAAVFLVHIGGHIAFDIDRIVALCQAEGIVLIEDCAHSHGASWNGRKPGSFGDAGIWSFAPTKTISTGEGGLLVSKHADLVEFARGFRNYGKPDYSQPGLNYRMNEFTAAVGLLGAERMEEIVAWKNKIAREELDPIHPARLELPEGMVSGYYKYIVFEELERSTGKVYDEPCHRVMGHTVDLPNTDWVAENHWCAPLYYRPAEVAAELQAVSG